MTVTLTLETDEDLAWLAKSLAKRLRVKPDTQAAIPVAEEPMPESMRSAHSALEKLRLYQNLYKKPGGGDTRP